MNSRNDRTFAAPAHGEDGFLFTFQRAAGCASRAPRQCLVAGRHPNRSSE
jgi:hypothetical protein